MLLIGLLWTFLLINIMHTDIIIAAMKLTNGIPYTDAFMSKLI